MSDINLLQSTDNVPRSANSRLVTTLNIVGTAVLLAAIAATVGVYFISKSEDGKLKAITDQQIQLQNQITADSHYSYFLAEQKKIGNLKLLLDHHINWSVFFPKMFQATIKNVVFTKFSATKDGQADITGVVPTFADLDKLIQGFSEPDYNSYIKDVKLVNVGVSGGGVTGVLFTIRVSFNNEVILPNDLTQALLSATGQ